MIFRHFLLFTFLTPTLESPIQPTIAIVGAGFAGLRAARRLQELGISYTIFEGANRIGGRVFPFAYRSGYLEYGAEYVNGEYNEIYEIVKRNALLETTKVEEEGFETILDGQTIDERIGEVWSKFETKTSERMEEEAADGRVNNQSVGERIDAHFGQLLRTRSFSRRDLATLATLKELFKNQYELEWAARANDFCLKNFDTWNVANVREATLNKFGFKTILDEMAVGIGIERIRLNSTVSNIDYSEDKVRLALSSGQVHTFDSVIVTSSLGFLKKHRESMFTPKLGALKSEAIERSGFGNTMKIYLEFERPWWTPRMAAIQICDSAASNRLLKSLNVFLPSLWAPNILIAWLAGDGPEEVAKLSDSQLTTVLNDHISVNLKHQFNVTRISRIFRHNWISDEFALGSYSYISQESCQGDFDDVRTLGEPILRNHKPVVCFAGEHTDPDMYQTTVGAARSGLREADRLHLYYSYT